jgi:hypothetical protein
MNWIYCGEACGWFFTKHPECEENCQAVQNRITAQIQNYFKQGATLDTLKKEMNFQLTNLSQESCQT